MAQNFDIPSSSLSSTALPLQTETYGDSGTHLVFLHGWGLNSAVWQNVAKLLSDNYQVTLIDLPGFGHNHQVTLKEYSLELVTELVADSIQTPAVVIGWSLGGLVATQLSLSYPEKVKGLINVTSSPCFIQQENWPGIEGALLKNFHHMLAKSAEETISTFLKIQAMGSPHLRQDIKRMQTLVMSRPQPSADTLNSSLNLLEQVDLRTKIHTIKQPSLRIYGRLDTLVPKAAIAEIAQLAPQSQQLVLEKASHAPFISHEDDFVKLLCEWLEQQG